MHAYDLPSLRQRPAAAHKGDFGRALLVGGSRGMAGSISLSAMATLRSGAGLVHVAVPDQCLETVAGFEPALMTIPLRDERETGQFADRAAMQLKDWLPKVHAIGCGPGMGTEAGAVRIMELLVAWDQRPRVFDADALNTLAKSRGLLMKLAGALVFTPHPGELERLTDVPASDRGGQIAAAGQLAQQYGAVIVVKGGPTVVVDGSREWTCRTGNPGMATAGSGDVLTGMITAFLAQAYSPWDASRLAVHLHGLAGDLAAAELGQASLIASDLLRFIPSAFRDLSAENPAS